MAKKKETEEQDKELEIRANSTFVVASELSAIVESIIENDGECPDEVYEKLTEWKGALESKAQSIGHVIVRLEQESGYFKAVEDAAKKRKEARGKAVDRLKKYLKDCMELAQVKSIKDREALFSFSVSKGRTKVVITDQNKLPFDMVEIVETVKPNAKLIKERLEAGEEIDGAILETGESYLTMRK